MKAVDRRRRDAMIYTPRARKGISARRRIAEMRASNGNKLRFLLYGASKCEGDKSDKEDYRILCVSEKRNFQLLDIKMGSWASYEPSCSPFINLPPHIILYVTLPKYQQYHVLAASPRCSLLRTTYMVGNKLTSSMLVICVVGWANKSLMIWRARLGFHKS